MRFLHHNRFTSLIRSLQALTLVGFAWLAAAENARSQVSGYAETPGPTTGPAAQGDYQKPAWWSLVRPAVPFTWDSKSQLGSVTVPIPGTYGWTVLKADKVEIRTVPSLSGDPTFEAIILPPASGHPTRTERITIQVPLHAENIPGSGALVIGFHSYSVTEKSVFNSTDLPAICAQKGWTLLAPYGLIDTHFGNVASQKSLDAMIALVDEFLNFDRNRIYTVGFSMGGGAAMSYAMRRRSEDTYRVAGVVNHTGTMDLLNEYSNGSTTFKAMLANPLHFGNPPFNSDLAFPYERVSPGIVVGGALDLQRTPARNLNHLAIYTYVNPGDPQTGLVQDNLKVAAQMMADGANINYVSSLNGIQHHWNTMDMYSAMDWISRFSLPKDPKSALVYADRKGDYHYVDVRASQSLRTATFGLGAQVSGNTFTLSDTRFLDEIAIDLDRAGLATNIRVKLVWSSPDASSDIVVLKGYPLPPASVEFDGILSTTWTHDPVTEELSITTPTGPTGSDVVIVVAP